MGNPVKPISDKERSHIKNMIALAMADGQFTQEEEHVLFATAHRLGMSEEELDSIKADSSTIEFNPPESYGEKIEQIYDFISLVSVDGNIDEAEIELCKSLALKLNLAPRIIDDLISKFFGSDKSE